MSKLIDFSKPIRPEIGCATRYYSFRVLGPIDGGINFAVAYRTVVGSRELLITVGNHTYFSGIENVPPEEEVKDNRFWLCYIDGTRGGAKVAHKHETTALEEAKRISQIPDILGKTVYVCEAKHAVTTTTTTTVKSV